MDGYDAGGLNGVADGRWFDDIMLGERFGPSARRVSPAMIAAYREAAGLSAAGWGAAGLIGHVGIIEPFHLLLHSVCTGFADAMPRSLIRLVSQSCRFSGFAAPGDLLHPKLQVIGLEPDLHEGLVVLRSTIHTQHGELLMQGEQHYLVRCRPVIMEPLERCLNHADG